MVWRRAKPEPLFFELAWQAVKDLSRPPPLEQFAVAMTGGGRLQPRDIYHQGYMRTFASDGTILMLCELPPIESSFDTLAFYNAAGSLVGRLHHPSPPLPEGGTIYAYMAFPRE